MQPSSPSTVMMAMGLAPCTYPYHYLRDATKFLILNIFISFLKFFDIFLIKNVSILRQDWYQTDADVVLSLMIKGLTKEHVNVAVIPQQVNLLFISLPPPFFCSLSLTLNKLGEKLDIIKITYLP